RRVAAGWARFDPGAGPFGRAPGGDVRRPPLAGGPGSAPAPGRPGAPPAARRPDRRGARPEGTRGPAPDPNAARDFRRPRVMTVDGHSFPLFPEERPWDPG